MKNVLVILIFVSFTASAELKLTKVYGIKASDQTELVIGAVNGELNKNPKSHVVEFPQGEHELALLCTH